MKKGFTLIELLAVIVILAIIALIATPIVLNIIKDSRESAGLRSAEMYLDAVEQSISVEKMNNTKFNPNTCTITEQGNLDCDTKDGILEVKVNGDKPLNGKITFENGKIKDVSLEYSNNKLIVKNEESKLAYKNYISINNYQHKHTNGTIEDHEVTFDNNGHGTCSKCKEEVLMAGLYDDNDNLVANWDTLVNDYGLDITADGVSGAPLTYPNNPESLASRILQNNDLTTGSKFVIKENVTKIGISQFLESSIKEVLIPNSVTNIGASAFRSSKNLKLIEIPSSVINIGGYAFCGCSSLISIKIPNSVTSIGDSAFESCTGLKSIEISTNVKSISYGMLRGCTNLTSIKIPNSVTSIGDYAFYVCSSLTSIAIPDSVTSIGNTTFNGCTNLTTIYYSGTATNDGNNWGATNATIKPYSEAPKELLP